MKRQPSHLGSSQLKDNKYYFCTIFLTRLWIPNGKSREAKFFGTEGLHSYQFAIIQDQFCSWWTPFLLKPAFRLFICLSKSPQEGEQNEKTGLNWPPEPLINVGGSLHSYPPILEITLSDYLGDGASVWVVTCHSVPCNNHKIKRGSDLTIY